MIRPNTNQEQVDLLKERYDADPKGLSDTVILVPASKVVERKRSTPELRSSQLLFLPESSRRHTGSFSWALLGARVGTCAK